jgi:hypothetical protein
MFVPEALRFKVKFTIPYMILKSRKCLVIIKLFWQAGGAAVLERMKSEKGNSRGNGSGFWGFG